MNNFQNVSSGAGLLKTAYPTDTPVYEALRRKRKTLEGKIGVPTKAELETGKPEEDDEY